MKLRNLFSASLLCLLLGAAIECHAQPGGGEDFGGRMLRRLDRNGDGSLDSEELDQAGPLKDFLARQNVDTSRPVPLGVIAEHQTAMFQEMRNRNQPRGEDGADDDGSSNDNRDSDRGNRGGGTSSGRGGPSRTDAGSNATPGGDRRSGSRGRRSDGAPAGPGGKTDPKSKVRVGRVGPKANLPPTTLPAQYVARDTNQDGQIGMYEWSKTDLSTFRRLDIDGDGFITPEELASPGSGTGGGSTTVASTSGSGTSRTGSVAKPAVAPSGPPADLKTVAAQGAFDFLDNDKNGQLTEEEWGRGRYAKKLFTEANVVVTFPLAKEKFVETYVKLAP